MNDREPEKVPFQRTGGLEQNTLQKLGARATSATPRTHIIVGVTLIAVLLIGQGLIFYWGKRQGSAEQKKAAENLAAQSKPPTSGASEGRWTYTGKVTTVSDTSITIKTTSGQSQTAIINDKTSTENADGSALAPKKLKKDTTVVISGVTTGPGPSVAGRIRVDQD